ncbi:MAG: TolC family protein [Planctomycetota bacterium]|nr:TolC family protein [Planctomycetota bacterium]
MRERDPERRSLARRTAPALLALVCGCASYEPRPLDPAQSAERYLARRLDDPELVRFAREDMHLEYPPPRWGLDSLWAAAVSCDPTIVRLRAEEGVTRAGQRKAAQRDNPELSIQPELATNAAAGANPWVLGLQAWLPLQTGSRRERQQDLAAAEVAEARLAPLEAAWEARLRVRDSLLAVLAGDRARELAMRTLALSDEELAMVRARFAAGSISRLDLRSIEDDRERAARSVEALGPARVEERARLAAAVGVGSDALASVELEADEFERIGAAPTDSRAALAIGLTGRTDLLRGLAAYAVAERALALEVERARPDLRLGPGFQFDQGTTKWQLGLSFELPIFHQHQGEIAEAEARRAASQAAFEELQARAIGEIQVALQAFERRRAELDASEDVLARAARRRTDVVALVAAGESDRLELLIARRRELEAEQLRIEALLRAQLAQTTLERALEHALQVEPKRMQP